MLKLPKVPVLKGVHWAAHRAFERMGFEWEVRRSGESGIGVWKISFTGKTHTQNFKPKRLVIVPGFGDSPMSWAHILLALQGTLKREFDEVVLVDFPGFTGFLAHEKFYGSFDLLLQMVEDLLDSLKPHTILGHSLGGWLTAHYATVCSDPERPRPKVTGYSGPQSILLFNPSGLFDDENSEAEFKRIFERTVKEGFQVFKPHLFAKEPLWFRLLEKEFHGLYKREDMQQFMKSVREDHYLKGKLKDVRAQVWLIWGEKDTLCKSCWAESWMKELEASHQSRAAAVMIPDAGHCPQVEKPAVTVSLLKQIFSRGNVSRSLFEDRWKVLGTQAP